MSARVRLGALVVATMTLLAFATAAEQRELTVTPAAPVAAAAITDLAPVEFWCAARRPHAADEIAFAGWYDIDPGVATARCAATHPGAAHFYYVTIWDQDGDGVVELIQWTPLGPWWT